MSNIDTVKEILRCIIPNCIFTRENPTHVQDIANELADAGLLMPDLPAPSQKLLYGDSVWKLSDKAFVSSWVDEAGPMVELSVGRGRYATPTEAREIAYMLLAAAQWAEQGNKE